LVEAVNDFHYAMINDQPRNEFYYECLQRAIIPGVSIVLEIGTGSGVLAMLAVRLGARRVVAIEASTNLAELAKKNFEENGLSEKIEIIMGMSTEISSEQVKKAVGVQDQLPNVIVSELFGTLLLGESALEYLRDARERLACPNARIIPPRGTQYAAIVECADVHAITSAANYRGISLRHINLLQDTSSVVFTKQYGFRFSSVSSTFLSQPLPIFQVDFAHDIPGMLSYNTTTSTAANYDLTSFQNIFVPPYYLTARRQDNKDTFSCQKYINFNATADGIAHCVLVFWQVSIGLGPNAADWERPQHPLTMSTDPRSTINNFARDMQWGQAIQLLEDIHAARIAEQNNPQAALTRQPSLLTIQKGDSLHLGIRFSADSVVLQFELLHSSAFIQQYQHLLTSTTTTNGDPLLPPRTPSTPEEEVELDTSEEDHALPEEEHFQDQKPRRLRN